MNGHSPFCACPSENEWSFVEIEKVDSERARQLERFASACQMVRTLVEGLEASIESDRVRFSVDSVKNHLTENRRLIVQFQVSVDLYDWFFNARTGYRAQFWRGSAIGDAFNTYLVSRLREKILKRSSRGISARRVIVTPIGDSKEEWCEGAIEVDEDFVARSLHVELSKIWICEWLARRNGDGPSVNLGFAVLSAAGRCLPRLLIARWGEAKSPQGDVGEGTRAPFPIEEHAWLDIKGAFIDSNGLPTQLKPPSKRAEDIFTRGWT